MKFLYLGHVKKPLYNTIQYNTIGIGLGIRIGDLNQIADLKLSILVPVKFRSLI